MSSAKDARALVAALRDAGYTVELATRSGHYRATCPTTGETVTLPSTPSDWRSLHQACHNLKRKGFRFTFKGKTYLPRQRKELR